ncbi:hypothetical protein F2P81_025078 [Scophthalmus maximus]|uniref:Uncharacterized protein n=1 Tax=Scophthalmus maximus TaxID=52904 RepID=A0A6A4RJP4_SCOMX|nr:hypothetical protein F2P81_025078 [Scophthalmus maximus]
MKDGCMNFHYNSRLINQSDESQICGCKRTKISTGRVIVIVIATLTCTMSLGDDVQMTLNLRSLFIFEPSVSVIKGHKYKSNEESTLTDPTDVADAQTSHASLHSTAWKHFLQSLNIHHEDWLSVNVIIAWVVIIQFFFVSDNLGLTNAGPLNGKYPPQVLQSDLTPERTSRLTRDQYPQPITDAQRPDAIFTLQYFLLLLLLPLMPLHD